MKTQTSLCFGPILCLLCLLAIEFDSVSRTAADTGECVLVFSDFHFDVFNGLGTNRITDINLAHPITAYNPSSTSDFYGNGYGTNPDTSFYLIDSAITNAYSICPNPAAILYLGDLLAHDFDKKCANHPETNIESWASESEQIIANLISNRFPHVPVIPVLGNNDSTKDYMTPDRKFRKNFTNVWDPLVPESVPAESTNSFASAFTASGHYIALLTNVSPRLEGVVFNSTFFAQKDQNLHPSTECRYKELNWLSNQLECAKSNNMMVWLLFHIPPGQAVYDGSQYWITDDGTQTHFLKLLAIAPQTVCICGHSHLDEFKVIKGQNGSLTYVHITPSVCPNHFNNPAYQVLHVDANGAITDYDTHYLANFGNTNWGQFDPHWTNEYTFTTAYGQTSYNVNALDRLSRLISHPNSNDIEQSNFIKYYSVSNPGYAHNNEVKENLRYLCIPPNPWR